MAENEYKAIFFDLDGTLLPIDMDEFLNLYFEKLRSFGNDRGYDGDSLVEATTLGVQEMILNPDGRLNAERFWDTFEEASLGTRDEWEPMFEEFYETVYDEIGDEIVTPNPAAMRAIQTCLDKGYTLYLTTMPLFPLIGVQQRLKWAGIDDDEVFDRITTYDNSSFAKPDPRYFQENVDAVGFDPEEILVVGNNTKEDLACMELGCDVYVVLDYLIDPDEFDVSSVKNGTLEEFADWCEALPALDFPDLDQ